MPDPTRRCYLCERDLAPDCFLAIVERKRRGDRVYEYRKLSYDCRDCRAEAKREQRRKRAEAEGRRSPDEHKAWVAQCQAAKAERKRAWKRAWEERLSKGGPHTYENVVLAHRSCNSRRGAGRFPVAAPQLSIMIGDNRNLLKSRVPVGDPHHG
jgi:hypothetical protein